jgi:hypothetical protein
MRCLLHFWLRRLGRSARLRRAEYLHRPVVCSKRKFLVAISAIVFGILTPVQDAGQACEADTE